MPAPIASTTNERRLTSLTRRRLHRASGAALIVVAFVVADTASAQGPFRRLGDRIRERAGGPVTPGTNAPATPASPLGRRPLLNGPLRGGPADGPAQPGGSATGPTAGPTASQSPRAGRPATTGATRSANYNRAGSAAQRMADPAASRVEQSSAWESRQDFRGNASPETAPPLPRQPEPALARETRSPVPPINPPSSRARLGVVVDTPPVVTPEGLPPRRARGALVSEVQPDSAAEVAGISVGDLIVGVDGRVITSVRDLTDQLSGYEPGDEARFQVTRDERLLTADVTLAGPDGIGIRRPSRNAPARTTGGAPSIMNGLGAAFGGLFSGPADGATPNSPPNLDGDAAGKSPAIAPEAIRNSLPESLPPPAPEKDED